MFAHCNLGATGFAKKLHEDHGMTVAFARFEANMGRYLLGKQGHRTHRPRGVFQPSCLLTGSFWAAAWRNYPPRPQTCTVRLPPLFPPLRAYGARRGGGGWGARG
jgi:hypothetical protein